jgi:hypothetical protein
MQGTRLRAAWTWGWRVWAISVPAVIAAAASDNGSRALASAATIGVAAAGSFLLATIAYIVALFPAPPPPRPISPRLDAANRWAAFASPLIVFYGYIAEMAALTSILRQTPSSPLQQLYPPPDLTGPAIASLAPLAAAAAAWLAGYFSCEPRSRGQEASPPGGLQRETLGIARTALLWGGFFATWSALFDISRGIGLAHWLEIAETGIGGALIGAAWAVMGMAIRRWRG